MRVSRLVMQISTPSEKTRRRPKKNDKPEMKSSTIYLMSGTDGLCPEKPEDIVNNFGMGC